MSVFQKPGCALQRGVGYQGRSLGLGSCCMLWPGPACHVRPKRKPLSGWSVLHSCPGTSLLWPSSPYPHSCHSCWYPSLPPFPLSLFPTPCSIPRSHTASLCFCCCCFWLWPSCCNSHSHKFYIFLWNESPKVSWDQVDAKTSKKPWLN